jgi:DNA-binding CsgD family transcriptional regulator
LTKRERERVRARATRLADELSPAQRRVFDALLLGGDSEDIARRTGISWATARNHIVAIFKVFGVKSRLKILAMFVIPPGKEK